GCLQFSPANIVSIPDNFAGQMKVYPTVSSGSFNISFQEGSKEDWNISIYSITGKLVQQSLYQKTNFVHYNSKTPMHTGIYFVTAENVKTREIQKSKIIIQ
ncbi:MAG: T9SS type A sorting domain-containing protein, partial [Chitinophagaceae bacterium]